MSQELNNLLADMNFDEALKPYQKEMFDKLVAEHGEDGAAMCWLTASGPNGNRGFGGIADLDRRPFWDMFMVEIRKFLCGDKKYKAERDTLIAVGKPTATVVVNTISIAVAPTIGMVPAVLIPVVAIVLKSIGKVTLNAWCAT